MTIDQDPGEQFEKALLSLNRLIAKNVLAQAQANTPLQKIDKLIVPALQRIGEGWVQGKIALSQVYMSGRICEELVDRMLPPADPDRKNQPRMAIAVLEDYHLLGKRIVYSMLRASGFELFNYNRVMVDELVQRVQADRIEVLLISTLMLPSALRIKEVRAKLNQLNLPVKIVVGGAPFIFDPHLWREVQADAMGRDATEAITIVTRLSEAL